MSPVAAAPRRPWRGGRTLAAAPTALLASLLLACSSAGPPSILLVVLDAARADHVGLYGYPRPTTPHLDALADEATVYTTAVSDAAFTFAAVAALLTGEPPTESGVLAPGPLPAELELLAERASEHGYRTLAYSENPHISAAFGFQAGFDVFDDAFSMKTWFARKGEPPPFDRPSAIERLLDAMAESAPEPCFAYVHLLVPHNPYRPPAPYLHALGSRLDRRPREGLGPDLIALDEGRDRATPERLANIVALYDENLAYGDALVGELVAGLQARGLLDATTLVVTADHGEAFAEHGRMLHSSTVYEEMIRVPLLVRIPGAPAGEVEEPVQLSDLGAALQEVVAGEAPVTSLASLSREGRPTLSWTIDGTLGVRSEADKLVLDGARLAPLALFDLARDPGERHRRVAPGVARPLLAFARGLVAAGTNPALQKPRLDAVDAETLRRLRALGYANEE